MNKNFSSERNTKNTDVYNQNIPELRFKEFNDEWDKKYFGDLFSIKNGLNKGKDYFGHGTPILNYMDVNQNVCNSEESVNGLVEVTSEEIDRYGVNKNDLFLTRTSETSDEIGLTSTYQGNNLETVFSGFILRARPKINNIDSLFYAYYLRTSNMRNNIIKYSSITTRALINGNNLSKMKVKLPSIEEQNKIASFLSAIDKKIDLMEKKHIQYKNIKKYYLQNIFSSYDDCEIVKLDDLFNSVKGKGLSKENIDKNGKYSCILYGELYTTYSQIIENVKNKTNRVEGIFSHENDILMPCSTTTTGKDLATASVLLKKNILLGGDITILRKKKNNLNEIFFAYYLSYGLTKKITTLAQGTTIIHIYWNHIKKINVKLPPIEEQENVSNFLTIIDKKISITSKKINLLNQFKKGLLQRMFI